MTIAMQANEHEPGPGNASLAGRQIALYPSTMRNPKAFRHEKVHVFALHLFRVIAENRAHRCVREHDTALIVHGYNRVGRCFGECAETKLAAAQICLDSGSNEILAQSMAHADQGLRQTLVRSFG